MENETLVASSTKLDYLRLKKLSRSTDAKSVGKLALMGDCATQHLATAIKGYSRFANMQLEVFESEYNQIGPQIIDAESDLYAFAPDYLLIYMCTEKLYESFCDTPLDSRLHFAETTMEQIVELWNMFHSRCNAKILQFTFVQHDDSTFGSFGNAVPVSFLFQVRKLNMLLMEEVASSNSAYLVDLDSVQSRYGSRALHDLKLFYVAKMPISLNCLPEVSKRVVDVIAALRGSIKKCVICDLDNTLWGGVIGDDGLGGIQVGELGNGRAFSDLQHWLKELKGRGILLAVCSKNNEDTAREPFEKHSEMVLHLDDFVMFVANWDDKASNIRMIQETLNIGMDSFVFLDDNPFERNLVKSMIPEIAVPELPEDPALYIEYLQSLNLFETASYSCADVDRTKMYKADTERRASRAQFDDYGEYLASLEMVGEVRPFDEFHFPRIAQLTQRSNQFNLRTIRYSESEVSSLANDSNFLTLYFTLRDKYSDHGLISVVVLEKRDASTLFINEWLMSCRVLKRGMEEFIVNEIISTAMEHGFTEVVGEYLETKKNAMVKDLYMQMGFEPTDQEGVYKIQVDSYQEKETYIKEEQ